MKKSVFNTIVTWVLIANMAMVFGWFDLNKIITTKTVRTVFIGSSTKQYVTITGLDGEIIEEYVLIDGERS